MSYAPQATVKPDPTRYAKQRGEIEQARQYYEHRANVEKDEAVERERRHFQAIVDAEIKQARIAITQAVTEAETWQRNTEEIYAILEDTTRKAEARIAELEAQVTRLQKEVDRLRSLRSKAGKAKRLMNKE